MVNTLDIKVTDDRANDTKVEISCMECKSELEHLMTFIHNPKRKVCPYCGLEIDSKELEAINKTLGATLALVNERYALPNGPN